MKIDVNKDIEEANREIAVLHIKGKITVMSPYELTNTEIKKIKELFPAAADSEVVNVVDGNIYSGLIIKIGSRIIDLTLNGALQNLRKQIYESN